MKKGFTLIEFMVVCVIFLTLAVVAIPIFLNTKEEREQKKKIIAEKVEEISLEKPERQLDTVELKEQKNRDAYSVQKMFEFNGVSFYRAKAFKDNESFKMEYFVFAINTNGTITIAK